jgi:exonuclease SbcD
MRVAAFADCHIGAYGSKIDAETALNARLIDCVNSLRFVVDDAKRRGAELLLFAGDMFRSPTAKPTPTELVFAARAMRGPLPIIAIDGNHDVPRSIGEVTALAPLGNSAWLEMVAPHFEVRRVGEQDIQLAYLPWPNRSALAATLPDYQRLSPADADRLIAAHLESILRGLAAQVDPSMPSILLAHISIDSAEVGAERQIMAGKDITIPLSAIPQEFTFAVLGHVHKPQDFAAQGRPNVFYCGSTERINFGEEGEDKSYVLLDTDAGTWERVPIPCRRYKTFHAHMEEGLGVRDTNDFDFDECKDAIVRMRITRPETVKPNYAGLREIAEQASCFDFRGFVEEVERTAAVRSKEIVEAQSLTELLGVWHRAKTCEVPLEALVDAGDWLLAQTGPGATGNLPRRVVELRTVGKGDTAACTRCGRSLGQGEEFVHVYSDFGDGNWGDEDVICNEDPAFAGFQLADLVRAAQGLEALRMGDEGGDRMKFWASWWSSYDSDKGCTEPPFEVWLTGEREAAHGDPGHSELSFCALVEAESVQEVWEVVRVHYPDFEPRFANLVADDWSAPADRFQREPEVAP